jgi:peptidoglycan/xylan/chitin deacetylase (PgdA/CDA1 family)
MAMQRNPHAVEAMLESGWEIASHGYRWINYQYVPEETEREHMRRAIEIHTRLTGSRPLGWYTGRTSPNTARLVSEQGGFFYDSDSYSDDLPYYDSTWGRPQLILPYTLDTNDMRFAAVQGFNTGDDFFNYLKDAFDTLYAEGESSPKMLSIGLHCRIIGRPARIAALAKFLDYIAGFRNVWVARRLDIARVWADQFPPPA